MVFTRHFISKVTRLRKFEGEKMAEGSIRVCTLWRAYFRGGQQNSPSEKLQGREKENDGFPSFWSQQIPYVSSVIIHIIFYTNVNNWVRTNFASKYVANSVKRAPSRGCCCFFGQNVAKILTLYLCSYTKWALNIKRKISSELLKGELNVISF